MPRRKCYHCNEFIGKDEDFIKHNISPKQVKNFHIECLAKFIEHKKLRDIEVEQRNKLFDYVKYEIMNYSDEKKLSPSMINKLISLRNGEFVKRGDVLKEESYDYDVILTTFKAKKIDIVRSTFGKTFTDDNHKFNYIMVIIKNSINDVAKRIENVKQQKFKEAELMEILKTSDRDTTKDKEDVYEEYKKIQGDKPKLNKVADLFKDLF